MKKSYTIIIAIVLLVAAVGLMTADFFTDKSSKTNIYEYTVEDFKNIADSLISYTEIEPITISDQIPKAIAIVNDTMFIGTESMIYILTAEGKQINAFKTSQKATCILADRGKIYLGTEEQIELWTTKGDKLQVWDKPEGTPFFTSLALKGNDIYAADAGNRKVYKYDFDGKIQMTIGEKKPESGFKGFFVPSPYFDLLIGREGQLWIVNPGYHRFEAFNQDGELFSSWENSSMGLDGFSGCCNPTHIAMMSDGSFVTVEKGLVRIKVHSPTGTFSTVVASPKNFEEGTTGLDLAINSKNDIFVVDPIRKKVRVFVKK